MAAMKSPPKNHLIAFCILVLTGFFLAGSPARAEEPAETAPAPIYIDLPNLAAPVMKGRRVTKYLLLTLKMELAPDADPEAANGKIPRLQDAFLRETYLIARENKSSGNVDVLTLRDRLLEIAQQMMGEGTVTGLLFVRTQSVRA